MASPAVAPNSSTADRLSRPIPHFAPSPPTTPARLLAPPTHTLPLCCQEVLQACFLQLLVLHLCLLAPPLLHPLILCKAWLRHLTPLTLLHCPIVHLCLVPSHQCHRLPSLLRPITLCCSGPPTSTQPPRCRYQGNSRTSCGQDLRVISQTCSSSQYIFGTELSVLISPSGSTLPRVLPLCPPLRVEALFTHSPSSTDRAEKGERGGSCLLSFLPGDAVSLLISEPRDGWHYGQNERTGR